MSTPVFVVVFDDSPAWTVTQRRGRQYSSRQGACKCGDSGNSGGQKNITCTSWHWRKLALAPACLYCLENVRFCHFVWKDAHCSKFWSRMGERPGQRQIGGEVECEEAFAQAGGRDQGVPRCVQEGGWRAAWKAAFALASEFSIFGFSSST